LHGIHRELGKGHDEVIYNDALVAELSRAAIPFSRERNYEITYKGVILPHCYYADFVVWDKIPFEAKAVEKPSQTSLELSRCLKTPRRLAGEWRRQLGVETSHFIDTNDEKKHELHENFC
jgi:hypothetical protein